jgi:hypothetical protein
MDKIEQWQERGWAPVRWAHHPPAIKDALRRIRMRPMIKQCYRNAQLFILRTCSEFDGLEYREGIVISEQAPIPIMHAWLGWQGEAIDLTLDDAVPVIEWAVPLRELGRTIATRGHYGPIRTEEFNRAWRLLFDDTDLRIATTGEETT